MKTKFVDDLVHLNPQPNPECRKHFGYLLISFSGKNRHQSVLSNRKIKEQKKEDFTTFHSLNA